MFKIAKQSLKITNLKAVKSQLKRFWEILQMQLHKNKMMMRMTLTRVMMIRKMKMKSQKRKKHQRMMMKTSKKMMKMRKERRRRRLLFRNWNHQMQVCWFVPWEILLRRSIYQMCVKKLLKNFRLETKKWHRFFWRQLTSTIQQMKNGKVFSYCAQVLKLEIKSLISLEIEV